MSSSALSDLEKSLGYKFSDISLLQSALVHRSYAHENPDVISNERLEFLGDAVLGWVVADYTYRDPEHYAEGRLTDIRKIVVNANALSHAATRLGLGEYLQLGRSEDASGGRTKASILSDAFEAVIAAVYLDGGASHAHDVVLGLVRSEIEDAAAGKLDFDYKTLLQEFCAREDLGHPKYTHKVEGPQHEPTFYVTLKIDGKTLAKAEGGSKKAAEQVAAEITFKKLNA